MTWKIVTGSLGFCLGVLIIYLVRHDHLRGLYGVWWFLLALMSIILGIFPEIVDYIGRMLGVYYPPMLLMVGALVVLFAKNLFMDIERSKLEQRIRILARENTLLKRALLEQAKISTEDSPRNQEEQFFVLVDPCADNSYFSEETK